MRNNIFFIIILLTSFLSAEDSNSPYVTSENDSLSLVEGVVNAYNGKLVQMDKDIYIQSNDPLELIRYYDGGHHFLSRYGYGVGFSFPITLRFSPEIEKQNVWVEQRGGSFLAFNATKQKNKRYIGKIDSKQLKSGYTNCCEALLRGEVDILAMTVDGTNDEFIVNLGNGCKRYYQFVYRDETKVRYYRLTKEMRPNGNCRYFEYISTSSFSPKKVWTSNRDNSLILDWINFNFEKENLNYTISGSNGQKVNYRIKLKHGVALKEELNCSYEISGDMYLLSGVLGEHFSSTEYDTLLRTKFKESLFSTTKVKRPDGRALVAKYNKSEKVEALSLSGIDKPIYRFVYKSGYTLVTDAIGNIKRFDFNKRRLSRVTESYRVQLYKWSEDGKLLSHIINNSMDQQISKKDYVYDLVGNIVETKLTGTIRNNGSIDSSIVKYVYSQDGRNNIVSENHNDEKQLTFSYVPGTNLVAKKLTYVNKEIVEREFNEHDKNGITTKKIVDDGSGPDVNDLTNVSCRRITEIIPQLNPSMPGITLPSVVRECCLDLETGQTKLLKRTEKFYVKGDLLKEEKIYDSNNQYCYSTSFEYNNKRELVREVDALGQATIYKYDSNGNKIYEEKLGSNKKITYVYDIANRLVKQIDEHDQGAVLTTSYDYDEMSNRVSAQNHFGQITTFQYDQAGREISSTDSLGKTSLKEFDVLGNIVKETDKDGYVTSTIYNIYGKPLETTFADGTTKRFAYNIQGFLESEWERDGSWISYNIDYQGRPRFSTYYGSDGSIVKVIKKSYKGKALVSETDANGNIIKYTYDEAGRVREKIQGDNITAYGYDQLGRLCQTTTGDVVQIKVYDYLDRVVEERVEDLLGKIFKKEQYFFDINGKIVLERIYSNENHYAEEKTVYNSQGNIIKKIDALGNQTSIIYNYSDHLEKEIIDATGAKEYEIYDSLDRIIIKQQFSSKGQLISYRIFSYDGRDHVVIQQEKIFYQGKECGVFEIRTIYDEMGQKISETEQSEKTMSWAYESGRLKQIIKPDGVILDHTYDVCGRLQELKSSDGTIHYRYSYDKNDNVVLAEDVVQNTTTERSYDYLNRLCYERQATGFEVSYAYDFLGRVKEVLIAGKKLTYSYSPSGLISATCCMSEGLSYTFEQQVDWCGKPISQILPNGAEVLFEWDEMSRCASILSEAFSQHYGYDMLGNLISTTVQDPQGSYDVAYFYDDLHQMEREVGPLTAQYHYDSIFNRRNYNGNELKIDVLNQVISDDHANYVYDKNGNRHSKGSSRYTYDALGRLVGFLSEDNEISYKYDPFGRRLERRCAGENEQFIYQLDTEIGKVIDGRLKEFRAIGDQLAPFAIELEGMVFSPIRNHRGDICVLLNSQYDAVSVYRYGAFGDFIFQGSIKSPWSFSSQRLDEVTGLFSFLNRDYDPALGRWLTVDPLGFADGPNLYAYVHNNPMTYVDPYGLWGESVFACSDQTNQFFSGLSRGFVDDASWGASNYILGEYQCNSLSSKIGYYTGTGVSLAAGCFYGATWLKGARYGGKFALNAYKITKDSFKISRAATSVMEVKNIAKIAQEATPFVQKIANVTDKSIYGLSKTPNGDWAKLSGMLRCANKGKGNFGMGAATFEQARVMGEAWVGSGFRASTNGKALISLDGMKQYRIPSYKPNLNKFQANFERKFEGQLTNTWQTNGHLDILN